MNSIPRNKRLVLFDGVCNLCNSSVNYIIKHDKKNTFLFTPLQSEVAQTIIKKYDIDSSKTDSILLYIPEKGVTTRSTAALKIAASLRFPNNLLVVFIIIPPFIRNWVYNYIAKNRYKWYGKRESCMLPNEELKNKFL